MTQLAGKQNLRDRVQKYLYTCSADSTYVQFIEKNKDRISDYLRKNKLAQKRADENLHEKDMLKLNVDRYVHAFKLSQQMKEPDMIYRRTDYIFALMGITLNTAAFLNTIELLGDEQQAAKWKEMVMNGKAFGGYGQTELGHGSNVQSLEMQAHYDEAKQVFRFKSPTITSAKYWPGVLGQVCTHSVVQAKTFVKGKSIGVQTFVFEVRDQDLKPIKGVKAGDIGPKFGFHRVDNGYLSANDVEVPRDCMLMKYVQVKPDGQVQGLENKEAVKYAYGSMLFLRVALPFSFAFGHIIYPARNLHTLYQKMGVANEDQYKKEIITYLSVGNGIIVANRFSQQLFQAFSTEINAKNFEKADKILVKSHIVSATFKALSSWKALKISSQIATRNSFTVFRTTGIPYAFNNIVPSVTYEGDNSVLLQQTARFILVKDKGEELTKPSLKVRDDDLISCIKMLKYVTAMEVRRLKKVFEKQFEGGVPMKTFWNEKHQRDIIEVSKLWGVLQFLQGFAETIDETGSLKTFFSKVGKVFTKNMLTDTPQIFTYGFEVQEIESWKEFTEEQFWALTHIERIVPIEHEQHKLLEREGNWIRSRL